ncbi:MAG: radical SAM protein [Sulfuricellaceae bacterium]
MAVIEIDMQKSVLFIYPNTTSIPVIPGAIPILSGIAHSRGWISYFFDAYHYEVFRNGQSRSSSAEFKPITDSAPREVLPAEQLIADLQALINDVKPDIVAVSCMTIDYEFLSQFWHDITLLTETVTIIGGLHAIICSSDIVKDGFFDIICMGEGEEVFAELLANIESGMAISDIVGTISIDRQTQTAKNNGRRNLIAPDKLWVTDQDYSIFSNEYFIYPFDGRTYRRFAFEVARGCAYSCTYCGNTALKNAYAGLGKFVRQRPVDSVIAGMLKVMDDRDIELFYLMDECFLGHPIKWLQEFSSKYAEFIRLPFIVQTRPETITPEKLDLLDAMGAPFWQVSMGVESGSERILFDVCNRRTRKERIRQAFAMLNERNIRTSAFFMIGFPYETREEIFETIELCRDIRPTVAIVSIFQPLPGQELRDVCIREGFISGNEPQISFTEGSILQMPQISAKDILNLRRVFMLYASLPAKYTHQIEQCEHNFEENRGLYDDLVALRWQLEKASKG